MPTFYLTDIDFPVTLMNLQNVCLQEMLEIASNLPTKVHSDT